MLTAWRPALVGLNLLLLATVAYFGARIVNAFVAAEMGRADGRVLAAAAALPPPVSAEPESAYAMIYKRDVFNSVKGRTPGNDSAETRRSDLNVKLWGTAVSRDPNRSYAIIEDLAARKQELYRVGDSILDAATLVRVEWDRVIIDRDGEEEVLELAFARAAAAAVPAVRGSLASERIRKTADNKFVIDRREIEKTIENLNEVFTQARAVPSFENGKTVGFRVFAIKPGSVFEKIGLQNGDIIQRVNGTELTDPTKAISLFTELQNEGHIAVDLQRNKSSKSFSYEIR